MNKNPAISRKLEEILLPGIYKDRMAFKRNKQASISIDLKHQLWASESLSGQEGEFEGA